MKIIGQPENYSEILERVFASTLACGFIYTALLAQASPAFRNFLDSMSATADFGPLKGIKALYVIIPLAIAVGSRAIRLHDRISDVLGLRQTFDTLHILFPLAEGAGSTLSETCRARLTAERQAAMYATFYPFAGFANPVIDRQLVRTAADNWSWFWAAVESIFLGLITLSILIFLTQWAHVAGLSVWLVVLLGFVLSQWSVCRRSASYEVQAILDDPARKQTVRAYFAKICGSSQAVDKKPEARHTIAPVRASAAHQVANEWDAFICHASEDKVAVVEPLAMELRGRGAKIWYDRWVLQIGDSLRRKIDEGLSKSRYGIVVLSPDFFRKEWPQHELDGLVQREIDGKKVILPIWHNVTRVDVIGFSVTLADKLAGSTDMGMSKLADEIEAVIRSS
jgi:TIR domain